MAVTAATLTSVAVFFPMVFITGVAGQLFKDQSLTVTFALAFSLVVALTLVPMLAAGATRVERRRGSRGDRPRAARRSARGARSAPSRRACASRSRCIARVCGDGAVARSCA